MDSIQKIWARIERRLKATGKSVEQANRDAKLGKGTLRNVQRGAAGEINTKGVSSTTLQKLAPALEKAADDLG